MTHTPENVTKFLEEYEQLCRKHNLMVFSEGESVEVDKADEDLWAIRQNTERWWESKVRMAPPSTVTSISGTDDQGKKVTIAL